MSPEATLDTEVYRDFFLAKFRETSTGRMVSFAMWPGKPLNCEGVRRLLSAFTIVTFNGYRFDMPVLSYALTGRTCEEVKALGDAIIQRNLNPWEVEREFGFRVIECDHIDLINVAPGMASLKIYGGRIHMPKMQDLPIEPDASIEPDQRPLLDHYCGNDLETTQGLRDELAPQIALRQAMSETYGIDLRSKSDAQIAEAVIKSRVQAILRRKVERIELPEGHTFKYRTPRMVRFESQALQDVLRVVQSADFRITDKGGVEMPESLSELAIRIGGSVYRMGIGGIHSSEESIAHLADEETLLIDRDVVSYYPRLILLMGLYPVQMGPAFLEVFRALVDERVMAKAAKDSVKADALKITVNGTFGKLGSKWSAMYSPNLMIQTTITGQLCLLMLIEALEARGIPVVSANTDGIVIKCPKRKLAELNHQVALWELYTGLETEATEYRALYSRDVNNYIAIKPDGKVKTKGAYAPPGLAKNPTNTICVEAVTQFLVNGVPLRETVEACRDLRKFLTVRRVSGGAKKGDQYLGKAVRWYYAKGMAGDIRYASNDYTVPRSEGAKPCMDLPAEFPSDLDFDWYATEAQEILYLIGNH